MESLGLLKRRRLGLTIANCTRVVRDLQASGEIDADADASVVAVMVLSRLVADDSAAYRGLSEIDWDAILDFIERLIPLILQLISLFTDGARPVESKGYRPVKGYAEHRA